MKRLAYWLGAVLVCAGVALHVPDYLTTASDGYRMVGMPMSARMDVGMVLLVVGLAAAAWGLLPSGALHRGAGPADAAVRYAALDTARLSPAHRRLLAVLTVALVVDTMKPATLGFVVPGMRAEYGLTAGQSAVLPLVAIAGTVAGSLLWGALADLYGRRATILLSALMYVATAVCGFMPSFGWNLVMCAAMGVAAGGMLPTVYALMSESVPASRRGALVVAQSGIGAALGYLVASGAASLLVPAYSWRALWLLGVPTGLILLVLRRFVPESPRYLLATGRADEAAAVMARYGIRTAPVAPGRPAAPVPAVPRGGLAAVFAAAYRVQTGAIVLFGLGWGIVNWGFITFLPTFLTAAGAGTRAPTLLFVSSLFAVPATLLAAVLYARWSSRRTMVCYALATAVVLVGFAVARPERPGAGGALIALTALLLTAAGGMIALLAPYATEVYPTELRASGSGVAAAAGKAGGLFGPLLLTSAPRIAGLALVSAVPVVVAAVVLWRSGAETAGRPLVEAAAESNR
jgi:putative MFS transporter